MSMTTRGALAALLALCAGPALAADHSNLEEGLPITIEDAYPIKENGLEVQSYFQYWSSAGRSAPGRPCSTR